MVARLELSRHPSLAGGVDVYMDARSMEDFSWPTFSVVSEYARTQLARWERLIRRHAIVVPRGVVGVPTSRACCRSSGTTIRCAFFTRWRRRGAGSVAPSSPPWSTR